MDADCLARGRNARSQFQRRRARAAADVEHKFAGLRRGQSKSRFGHGRVVAVALFLFLRPKLTVGAIPISDLAGISRLRAHAFGALRLREASVRKRSAFSLMNPAASF